MCVYSALHLGRSACVPERARAAAQSSAALRYQTTIVDVIRLGKHGGASLCRPLGSHPLLVEKDGERDSGDVQCAGGSIADKPMFHNAFKERRCVIPASRFFE